MNFRNATLEDGLIALAGLREMQVETVRNLGINPEQLLRKALTLGPATSVLIGGSVAGVFGVQQETMLGESKIWFIGTDLIKKEPMAFLRWSRRFTKELYGTYGTLLAVVDAKFERSRMWLQWCGFTEVHHGEFIRMRYYGGH